MNRMEMFFVLCMTLAVLCASGSPMRRESGQPSWNILKLTQSWPPAVCIFLENGDKKCDISSSVTGWVIHGLWPTKTGTLGPNFCNNSWQFDLSKVQVLRPKLDWNWPAISLGEKPEVTWSHEWDKHGTCGTVLPALKDEVHYFNVTLGLHAQFNLSQSLIKGGILPTNDRTYKAQDILMILQQALGASPTVICVRDKKTRKYFLEQVEVCLTKMFQPTDCKPSDGHSLLFESEASAGAERDGALGGDIQGCGSESEGIYYKPLPSKLSRTLSGVGL